MPAFFPGARENIAVPDDRKGQIVFKWPDMNIRRFTHAIVAPDELAVFMYQGEVKGTLPPGRHALDATEIPFLGIFADALTGGNLNRTEIYDSVETFYKQFYFRAGKIAEMSAEMLRSPQMMKRRLREGVEFVSFLRRRGT